MYDVITVGGLTRDIIFTTNGGKVVATPDNVMEQALLCFEFGAKIKASQTHFSLGGGACNTSVGLRRLGLVTGICACVGDDKEGEMILSQLRKEKVNLLLIQKDKKEKTGSSLVILHEKTGERTLFTYRGANENLEFNLKQKTKWIYVSSLSGKWQPLLHDIEKFLSNNEVKCMFNPGIAQIESGRKGLGKMLNYTNILMVNKDEAIELVYSDGFRNIDEPQELVEVLSSWGPEIVVVTDARRGAYAGNENGIYFAEAFSEIKRIDATGAGDSFGSGFLAGYIYTGKVEDALKYGIVNSNSVISYYGAHNKLLTKSEIEKGLKKVKVKKN